MKIIKLIITLFFLTTSYWVTYLVFSRNFSHAGIMFSAEDWNENTFMILLTSTGLSAVGVLFLGILSMFTHFVFVKLIYADEIKQAAIFYIKNRNKNTELLNEYRSKFSKYEWSKMSTKEKFFNLLNRFKQ
jgi:hypothetical protein